MFKKLLAFMGFLAIAASCDKAPIFDDKPEEKELVNGTVCCATPLPSFIDEAFRQRIQNITSDPSQADVIILLSSELQANKSMVLSAWENGKIIVEVDPDYERHREFWGATDAPEYLIDPNESEGLILLARQHSMSYCLQDPFILDGYLSNEALTEDDEATSSNENWDDEDIEVVDFDEEVEYLGTKLDSFVNWLNDNTKPGDVDKEEETEYQKFDGNLSGYLRDKKFSQIYEKTFNVGADGYKLCKIASSKADKVSRHSTVDVTITITPLYAYELNGSDSGDYYFVTAHVNSKNYDLFGKYKKKHGAIPTYAFAFYSEDIHWSAELVAGSGYSVDFFQDPEPQTTVRSTSYTTGFSTALNVTGQGGAMGGKPSGSLTIGGTFTWSNSRSISISDQEISEKTHDSRVDYDFLCLNFAKDDDANKAVPLIARSDQHCYASWCWHVNGTKDNDTTTMFTFKFTLDPQYGYMYRHASWWAEGHIKHGIHLLDEKNRTVSFNMNPPDRKQAGVLEYTSTNTNYLNNIKVLDSKGKEIRTAQAAVRKDVAVNFQLPVGMYSVRFDVRTGDGDFIERRQRDSVFVETGATTSLYSLDNTKVISTTE